MANHVAVTICGAEYTFVAEESAAYMHKIGAYVGEKMEEILASSKVGRTDTAAQAQSEASRLNDEITRLKGEAAQAQEEITHVS